MEDVLEIKDSIDCLSLETGIEDEASGTPPTDEVSSMEQLEGEVAEIQERMQEINDEVQMLNELQDQMEKQFNTNDLPDISMDDNSVYVGNVDYGTTVLMLENHFKHCGSITRLTIPMNKFCGSPKGYAYIEFANEKAMLMALNMDDTILRGRPIKVGKKRTNKPGLSGSGRGPRGRGFYGGPRGGFDTRPGRGGFSNGYSRPRMYSNNTYYTPY
ncbi:PREDICTED: polyadenylate-binding protein 2-like [Nicrophorus vespilloides]|uniref:Polyadenylate-binding protein 2-like n=1 Tax=Nicrophorus vespilloides TaxID=110193 RepID=A0ABM1N6M4_NICVS|nr:PREDICTED: polyadenylate-binding protein 2-like [Nicrophorus vespilloides]